MKIGVVGAGVSGLVAARLLSRSHDVAVFEAAPTLGGHAHSVTVSLAGQDYAVDTGFMVYNDTTYPHFSQLLNRLNVPSKASDMSFSVQVVRSGIEYCGTSLQTVFADPRNLFRPKFLRMLGDILRFNRLAARCAPDNDTTLGRWLLQRGLGRELRDWYLVPMAAAVWSSTPQAVLDFPVGFLATFFLRHGFLTVDGHLPWRVVDGGSRRYVDALVAALPGPVHRGVAIRAIERSTACVVVKTDTGDRVEFDAVVSAVHSDTALALLTYPTPLERELLGAMPYRSNSAVLHTDASQLPRRPKAQASWNYRVGGTADSGACVTYDLSRLQGLKTPEPICLTLNPDDPVAEDRILHTLAFIHPSYSAAAVAAQRRVDEISGADRIYYCGAYWGNGFHEDGIESARRVARHLGVDDTL